LPDRPYVFYDLTASLCSKCLRKVEAKILIQDGRVYLQKLCLEHGGERVLVSTDADYYRTSRRALKPGQLPYRFNTETRWGCPYDCGLCPDHEQHSCLTLVEVTDRCNLTCPICYSESSPARVTQRSLDDIDRLLDAVVANEREPDVVQISGGEPTIHPDFFEILARAKTRPIKHLMVNTNGIRIAREEGFARRLKDFAPGFEIYLQFDSLRPDPLRELRGADLRETRRLALERLNEWNVSTTLVVTLKKGVNDGEIGEILDFAVKQPCVRGVTFQPIQAAGRLDGFDPARDRLTLGEIRQQILAQSTLFQPADIAPVPCHPDCIAMAYGLKLGGELVPLTRLVDPALLLAEGGNTIVYERDPRIRQEVLRLFSTSASPDGAALSLKTLLCCLPQAMLPRSIGYDNVFRVLIIEFLDAYNFDVRSVKRSCIHIAHPDGRIIPFDTYNLFYRDGLEERLNALRGDPARGARHA
jgi:7,8-dihydro-6-hydroxymethylpterin dimethyltransferase